MPSSDERIEAAIGDAFEHVVDVHERMVRPTRPSGGLHACDLCDALNKLRGAILGYRAGLEAREDEKPCGWQTDGDSEWNMWNTMCGQMHQFESDGPAENEYRFCPYCGKPLVIDRRA